MPFPKKFKQVFLTFVAALVVAVFGMGVSLTPASAAVPGQLEATNFVVQEPNCGILAISFDFVGGPDDWYAKRDAANGGPTIASGSVATTTGNVSDLVFDQPAGTYDITLYGSSSAVVEGKGESPTTRRTGWMVRTSGQVKRLHRPFCPHREWIDGHRYRECLEHACHGSAGRCLRHRPIQF